MAVEARLTTLVWSCPDAPSKCRVPVTVILMVCGIAIAQRNLIVMFSGDFLDEVPKVLEHLAPLLRTYILFGPLVVAPLFVQDH